MPDRTELGCLGIDGKLASRPAEMQALEFLVEQYTAADF